MTECRRKTISVSSTQFARPQPPPPSSSSTTATAATTSSGKTSTTPRLPKSTSHPSPDSLLHLSTECPFGIPLHSSSPAAASLGNTFLFGSAAPKKKLSDNSFLFSPEKRAKRNPLHDSHKPNMAVTFDTTAAAKMLSLDSPSPSMKRSDVAILNLDQASLGSPVAKRPPRRQSGSHFHHSHPPSASHTTPRRPPSRSVSNQPRPHHLLHQQVQAQHFEFSTPAPPNGKVSRRISVENFLRPPSRDSPFGMPAPIVDASIHLPPQPQQAQQQGKRQPKPHPLSFAESALSTPSSASTVSTQQPTRPHNPRLQTLVDSSSGSQQTFYTPQAYKMAKPLQAAFMSEGLLSKRNRSNSSGPTLSSLHMPDTPCKRPLSGTFGVFPAEPSTPLSGQLRHTSLFFNDSDSSSGQDTPAPSNHRSLSYLSNKSDYEFPATPTKSVDTQSNTPGPLWRVHNLGKSPGGDSIRSIESLHTGLDFPDISPPKEHRRRSTTNGRLFQQHDLKGGRFGEKFEESQIMGTGEFSEVYEVVERVSGAKYAVKRTRFPMTGPKER